MFLADFSLLARRGKSRSQTLGDEPQSAVSCGFLRKSSVFFCEHLRLEFPGENPRFSAKICVLGQVCHLRSVTLSMA